MTLTQKNQQIINQVEVLISERGYTNQIFLEPVKNTFTRRPRYGKYKDGTLRFAIHMWEVNKLDEDSLQLELSRRVDDAITYFAKDQNEE